MLPKHNRCCGLGVQLRRPAHHLCTCTTAQGILQLQPFLQQLAPDEVITAPDSITTITHHLAGTVHICKLRASSVCLFVHVCVSAVYQFLISQKTLGLTDIAKATITEKSVRLNYVHGIWYQVRGS